MKILYVGNFLSGTRGTRLYCEDLVGKLSSLGHEIYTTSECDGRMARFLDMLTTTLRKRNEYDLALVDCYSGASFFWAEAVCQLLKMHDKPFCLVLHGGALPDFEKRHPRRVRRLLERATVVVTPSMFLQESFFTIRSDIRYLPNALDISAYALHERITVNPELIWLRAFHSSYQPQLAVRVLNLLLKDFPGATLQMIGPDKGDGSLSACQRLAKDYGISDKITFSAAVSKAEVPNRLQAGSIFLNTTRYESFGVAVLEAAACGLPIVSTSVGELPHLWRDQEDILLVDPTDSIAMAESVCRLLTESGLAQQLSKNAREKAEKFDWAFVLPQWEQLVTSLDYRH